MYVITAENRNFYTSVIHREEPENDLSCMNVITKTVYYC